MLGKLLKYEFRATGRVMLPFLGGLLVLALAANLGIRLINGNAALTALGFADFRVRLLDGCARLQLTEAQLPRALACRQQILAALAPLFDGVLLDLNSRAASQ